MRITCALQPRHNVQRSAASTCTNTCTTTATCQASAHSPRWQACTKTALACTHFIVTDRLPSVRPWFGVRWSFCAGPSLLYATVEIYQRGSFSITRMSEP